MQAKAEICKEMNPFVQILRAPIRHLPRTEAGVSCGLHLGGCRVEAGQRVGRLAALRFGRDVSQPAGIPRGAARAHGEIRAPVVSIDDIPRHAQSTRAANAICRCVRPAWRKAYLRRPHGQQRGPEIGAVRCGYTRGETGNAFFRVRFPACQPAGRDDPLVSPTGRQVAGGAGAEAMRAKSACCRHCPLAGMTAQSSDCAPAAIMT
jgi:hypothetical protein